MSKKIESQQSVPALSVAVLNYVSCGKTTIARQLLSPRLGNAEIIPIETINKDAGQGEAIDAGNFRAAMVKVDTLMANNKSVVVDIGASNIEACLIKMKAEKAFSDFDYFVIPITPDKRTMTNSVNVICDLIKKFGVPPSKIRIVFNRVKSELKMPISEMYASIFKLAAVSGFPVSELAVIYESEVFDLLGLDDLIAVSKTNLDWRELQRNAKNDAERIKVSTNRVLWKMSGDTVFELDTVFAALFGASNE